jgi:hypothetical protein
VCECPGDEGHLDGVISRGGGGGGGEGQDGKKKKSKDSTEEEKATPQTTLGTSTATTVSPISTPIPGLVLKEEQQQQQRFEAGSSSGVKPRHLQLGREGREADDLHTLELAATGRKLREIFGTQHATAQHVNRPRYTQHTFAQRACLRTKAFLSILGI